MRRLLTLLACLALLTGGCAPAPRPEPPPAPQLPPGPTPEPAKGSAADYFPYLPGMKLEYQGEGNEFASYVVTVLYKEGDKLEWRRDNGGTSMAEVYRLQPQQVTLIYREGEAYDPEKRLARPANVDQIVLKDPIAPGTTWTAGDTTYTIHSTTEKIEAMGKTITDVVVVAAKYPQSTVRWHYHKSYGMVLSVFESEGTVVESRLKAITGP